MNPESKRMLIEFKERKTTTHCNFITLLMGETYNETHFDMLDSYLSDVYISGSYEDLIKVGVKYLQYYGNSSEFIKKHQFVSYEGVVKKMCNHMRHYMFVYLCTVITAVLKAPRLSKEVLYHLALSESEDIDQFIEQRQSLIEKYNDSNERERITNEWNEYEL